MRRVSGQKRSGPSQRTPAERAAIDARADAYPRPLSATQVRALKMLRNSNFRCSVAGWHPPLDCLHTFSTQTMESLHKRRFIKKWRGGYIITAAGRREAARHR